MRRLLRLADCVIVGVFLGIGFRGTMWLIPAPETRVLVCMADDLRHVKSCETLADLIDKRTEAVK